jgi:hypothetical protein
MSTRPRARGFVVPNVFCLGVRISRDDGRSKGLAKILSGIVHP